MIVKVIFISNSCSSLYIAFAVSAYGGLDTVLTAIRIVIGSIVVTIVVTFIHQSGSLNDSDLNFTLTI